MPDRDLKVNQAAFLSSKGKTLDEIVQILQHVYGVNKVPGSKAGMGHYVKAAEDKGWLQHIFTNPGLSAEDRDKVVSLSLDYFKLSDNLTNASPGRAFRKLYVCYSGATPQAAGTSDPWDLPIKRYVSGASIFLEDALARSKGLVGVSFGRTIGELVSEVQVRERPPYAARNWTVVPTSGEPLDYNIAARSSTNVAAQLAHYLGGEAKSLKGVFQVIPEELVSAKPSLLAFFRRVAPHYDEIFAEGGLIDNIDILVTSVGSFQQKELIYGHELAKAGGRKVSELSSVAHGDLGGVVLGRQDRNTGMLDRSWTGISVAQVHKIVDRALKKKCGGVWVFALGENKAEVLIEAIKRGLVTYAVCDHHLAKAAAKDLGVSLHNWIE